MTDRTDHKTLFNQGLNALALGKPSAAAASFEAALAAKADFLPARKALSQAFYLEGRYAAAVAMSEAVIAAEPGDPANALNHGICLYGAHRFAEAAAQLARGLAAKQATLQHRLIWLKSLIHADAYEAAFDAVKQVRASGAELAEIDLLDLELRLKTNAWGDFERLLAKVREEARQPRGFASPSSVVGAPSLTGADLRRFAEAWTAKICAGIEPLPPAPVPTDRKIRIGYVSPDLQQKHPIGRHFQAVFAAHDRSAFDVIGYSLRPRHEKSVRLYDSFDRIHFLDGQSDSAVARLMRDDGIELLADLGVHTMDARPRILALRPAPVQISFIGHGGTMGASFMDYAIAPAVGAGEFTEAIAVLEGAVINGRWDRPEAAPVSRKELGISDEAVLFCSFCANTKITPSVFDAWIRLLREVPDSFLWLRDFGPTSVGNLRSRATAVGVAPERLLFARNESPARFFGRLQCADLFLDTAPYSAGSSATDALWAGLPLVTLAGETYVSRMAASALIASGLPDLVTTSLEGYFSKALELARDRPARARIRAHLLATRKTNPLFDAVGYTRRLERLYRKMSERYRRGENPAPLSV